MKRTSSPWLGVLPIPLLALLIGLLDLDIDPSMFYDPPWLILVGNTLFVTAAFLVVALIASRNYLATGRVQMLLLGCGVLAFAVGAAAAAAVRGMPDGANLNVTIYNTAALLAAFLHFAAAFVLISGTSMETMVRRRGSLLAIAYGGSIVLVGLLYAAAIKGWIPPFKLQGTLGFTSIRQAVLGSADALFGFSSLMFLAMYLRSREVFLYWYACALGLTALSLTAFFVQASVGSPVGWAERLAQYLGGVYFLVALVKAGRSAQSRRISLEGVLTTSLTGSEEKFRALAENVPDAIRRFDREIRHLYVNSACQKLYKRPTASVIGRTIGQVGLPPAKADAWSERIREVFRSGERSEVEEEYEAEGGRRYFQSFCVPEFSPEGEVANVLVVSRDLTARRQAERGLRESEERFRLIFEGMQESFLVQEVISDPAGRLADLRYLEVNPVAERQLGKSRAELVGRMRSQVQGPLDPEAREFVDRVLSSDSPAHLERWDPRSQRWFHVISFSTRPGHLVTLNVDITERKRSEEQLRELSQRLQTVLDAAPAMIWTAHDSSCRSITGNRAAETFTQVPPGTDMSKTGPRPDLLSHYRVFRNGRELTPEEMPIQQVAASGTPLHECEVEFRFTNGDVRFLLGNVQPLLDSTGHPAGAIAAFIDVTTHKLMETRLRDQYARREALSHIVAALLAESDPQKALERLAHQVMEVLDCQAFFNFLVVPDGNRLRLNACAGIAPAEAARIEWLEPAATICGCVAKEGRRIVAEDIQGASDPRTELVKGYGIRAYACHPLVSTGGKVIGTLSFGTRTRDRFSDEDLAYMKTVTDHIAIAIERKRAAEALAALNETLEQRVAERTREVSGLANQLRTLAAELARAEQRERKRLATILHDHIQQLLVAARLRVEQADQESMPARMRSSLRSLHEILDETLEASRNLTIEISPPVLKQAGLVAALKWLVDRMAEKNQFTVRLESAAAAEPDREEVRFLLFECIRELLFNSLKHSGERQAALSICRTDDGSIVVSVEDHGKGFQRREPSSKAGGVTAFGLFSIEQRLAHLGGSLEVDSAPGRGTRIRIVVPPPAPGPWRAREMPRPFSSPVSPPPQGGAGSPVQGACRPIRVLMVDDNKNMREGLSELLGLEQDIEVVGGAASGSQAIEMAERLKPDVIAMDLNLGGMDGTEAARTILRRNPDVKVIGLSMYVEEDVERSMRDAGAVGYVSKGAPIGAIVDAIRACRRPQQDPPR